MVIPPAAFDAKQKLCRAAHLDGGMAGVPRVGGQRKAVGTRADDRNIVVGGVHLALHGVQRIEPAVVAGVLPGKALHGLNDRQRGKLRQDVPAGEKLRALFILGEDRLAEGMHDQHPLARERGGRVW